MRISVAGQLLRCPVCSGEDFVRRYFSNFGRGAMFQRRVRPSWGKDSQRVARHYACERCSWTATFAGDTPQSPQEQG